MQKINQNLVKIADLLNDGQYHDGTSIGSLLHITRAAVWKVLKKLENYGIPLESVKGKGYLLKEPLILLDDKKIKTCLACSSIQLEVFEKLPSTNDYLTSLLDKKKIRVCIAETQSHGKGRLNRHWHSPFGQNIYLSMYYPFQRDISELSGLSLVVALATCKAIAAATQLEEDKLFVKWPNDIWVNQGKIAGILIELQAESNGLCQAIIGIGINVNMEQSIKNNVKQQYSSLSKITGDYYDRNKLCASLIDSLINYLERFSSYGLKSFLNEWEKKDMLFNKTVTLISGKNKHEGLCMGINEQGHLLLKNSKNKIHSYSAGDTTLS